MRIRQCSYWETHYLDTDGLRRYDEERDFNASYVIFRLGENVKADSMDTFKDAASKFVEYICPTGKVLFGCSGRKNSSFYYI